jgi:hypothetical protein
VLGADGSLCGDGVCQVGESPDWCGDCVAQQAGGSSSGQTQTGSSPTPTATPTEDEEEGPTIITATPEPGATTVGLQCPVVVSSLVALAMVVGPLGAAQRRRRTG